MKKSVNVDTDMFHRHICTFYYLLNIYYFVVYIPITNLEHFLPQIKKKKKHIIEFKHTTRFRNQFEKAQITKLDKNYCLKY